MSNRFSRYAGSKTHFIEKFNAITTPLNKKVYVEPFFGSGAIFFNLDLTYDRYVINDVNPHVINAVKSFRDGTYAQYIQIQKDVFEKFGDIKTNKESYYNFRNWFNAEYFGKSKDLITEGFMFHFLMNSCINSLVRIGPNGFNQSYGNRFFLVDEVTFNELNRRLNLNVEIISKDYHEVIKENDSPDTLFFLDPPYFMRSEVGYQKTYSKEDDLIKFIDLIKPLQGSVVYTDIACSTHDALGWNLYNTKLLSNISPLRRAESESQEVFFSNFALEEVKTNKQTTLF